MSSRSLLSLYSRLTMLRAGFYAENLLLYAPQAKQEGILPIPIGKNHKFPPVSLGVSLLEL